MKILNNSAEFPNMSVEQLTEELDRLNKSLELAKQTGTGTSGVESIIKNVENELTSRGVDIDTTAPTSSDQPEDTISQS